VRQKSVILFAKYFLGKAPILGSRPVLTEEEAVEIMDDLCEPFSSDLESCRSVGFSPFRLPYDLVYPDDAVALFTCSS
jgi:hypothetical protein